MSRYDNNIFTPNSWLCSTCGHTDLEFHNTDAGGLRKIDPNVKKYCPTCSRRLRRVTWKEYAFGAIAAYDSAVDQLVDLAVPKGKSE